MSELISALVIAVVQGLTEWVPVSSSGHLLLFEYLLGYNGGLMFDVALHFGTLMAVFVYFGGDIVDIVRGLLKGQWSSGNGRLGLLIIVATIPAVLVGYFLQRVFGDEFGSLGIVALGFGITGLFLLIALFGFSGGRAHPARVTRSLSLNVQGEGDGKKRFGYWEGFLVGCAQVFALFHGISRSGLTIGSGLLLGLDEKSAMKFSFLMSIPIIFGANVLVVGNRTLPPELIWASLVSFIVGLITIHLLYNWVLVSRKNLKWFAIYALLLAAGLGIYLGIS